MAVEALVELCDQTTHRNLRQTNGRQIFSDGWHKLEFRAYQVSFLDIVGVIQGGEHPHILDRIK